MEKQKQVKQNLAAKKVLLTLKRKNKDRILTSPEKS
jgi:hypothetical protein